MKTFYKPINIAINDIKIIFRDKSLLLLAIVPFLIFGLLKFGLPSLIDAFQEVAPYKKAIVTVLLIVMSLFPAFILSFIAMDEKESSLIQVFNTLPYNYSYLINLRMIIGFLYGFFLALIVLAVLKSFNNAWLLFSNAFLISLCGPQVYLIILTQSSQKVEAMTWMKGLNFVYMIPVVTVFLETKATYVFGLLPTYWLFLAQTSNSFLYLFIGIVQSVVYTLLLKQYGMQRMSRG